MHSPSTTAENFAFNACPEEVHDRGAHPKEIGGDLGVPTQSAGRSIFDRSAKQVGRSHLIDSTTTPRSFALSSRKPNSDPQAGHIVRKLERCIVKIGNRLHQCQPKTA